MVNFELIIEKVKEHTGISSKKELAVLFGLSPADFSNRLKRGTILPLVVNWAINENVNLDWLLKNSDTENQVESRTNHLGLSHEHLLLINTYESAEEPIKEAALTMLKNSAEKSKSTDRKDSDCPKLKSG